MGDFLTVLFGISIAGSVSFVFLVLFQRVFEGYSRWFYWLMKILLFFYSVPVLLVGLIVLKMGTVGVKVSLKNPDILSADLEPNFLTFDRLHFYSDIFVKVIYIWGIGAIVSFFITIFLGHIYIRRIRKYSLRICDPEIRCICNREIKILRIKKRVRFFLSPHLISPFTAGILKPFIVLPKIKLSESEFRLLLRHELTHLKSRDVFFKQLTVWVRIIHWFNPVMYMFSKKVFEFSEMACDERVIEDAEKEDKQIYAELLIKLLECSIVHRENVVLAGFDNGEKSLKRRLSNIMERKNRSNRKRILMAVITAVLIATCPVISYAATTSIMKIQNKKAEHIFLNIKEMEPMSTYSEHNSSVTMGTDEAYAVNLSARGDNRIDATIGKGERYWVSVTLSSSSIDVSLTADSASDSFQVGYSGRSGAKYVNSIKGSVSHSFSVSPGSYSIYIENLSEYEIHILGRITV